MKNAYAEGDVLDYQNGGTAIKSGDIVPLTAGIGVACADIAANAVGSVAIEGVYKIAKAAPMVMAQGAKLYWDNSAKKVTTTSSGNTLCGFAFVAALSADTYAYVKLVYMGA